MSAGDGTLLTTVFTVPSRSSWNTADAPHEEISRAPFGSASTPSRFPEGSFRTFCTFPPGPSVYTSPAGVNVTRTRVPSGSTVMPLGLWRSGGLATTESFPDGSVLDTASVAEGEESGRTHVSGGWIEQRSAAAWPLKSVQSR